METQLPYSEQVEKAVLGSLFLEASLLPDAHLEESDFYSERHRTIYRALKRLADADKPIDPLTVRAALEDTDELEAAGGVAYLASLDVDLPDIGRFDHYVEIVKERAQQRHLIELSVGLRNVIK
jgi:replicative DNA helicase